MDVLPEFRIIAISLEDLEGVLFSPAKISINEMNRGCFFCPRQNEDGDHHYCMDGCFNLPRRKRAGKIHKITHLKGLVRERLLFDTLVSTEDSLNCNTVEHNHQVQTAQKENDKVLNTVLCIYLTVKSLLDISCTYLPIERD